MTNESQAKRFRTEEAWNRLSLSLEKETVNPFWESAVLPADEKPGQPVEALPPGKTAPVFTAGQLADPVLPSPLRKKRMRWTAAAAACAVVIGFAATPMGNQVMADVLNQFRMQNPIVVDSAGMEQLFQMLDQPGEIGGISQYGKYSTKALDDGDQLSMTQIHHKLGYDEIKGLNQAPNYYVNPTHIFSLQLDVKKVNDLSRRLGVQTLLPEEADGRTVTLTVPAKVYYVLQEGDQYLGDLSQSGLPEVSADKDIPLQEVIQGLSSSPIMPEQLRKELVKADVLNGRLPLPIVTDGAVEQVELNGTQVILEQHHLQEGNYYEAYWIRNAQLYTLSTVIDMKKEQLLDRIKELIKP
ncbi:hypothetical protein Q5741_15420 [Paenibacillus sp. JX-17]|uniref:DUF4367 domain-containing protein n=1 Tax=Paenibacillus lacisoli TaxID=3064525 RepID=A0ABT9CF25_9BACL|nr:hypothetical protein [Paenibacillus sp. JX-17]MDO7907801.1 hypothetical protein [Paenibacillus sp. JX-17]